jgi:hypothetical protein
MAVRSWTTLEWKEWSGFHKIAARCKCGLTSLSNCRRLELRSLVIIDIPVTFPPGCASDSTSPDPTGSTTRAMTMGIVEVERLAISVATVMVGCRAESVSPAFSMHRSQRSRQQQMLGFAY